MANINIQRDQKFPVGTTIRVKDTQETGKVVRHGRDMNGVYTEIKLSGGDLVRYHRS